MGSTFSSCEAACDLRPHSSYNGVQGSVIPANFGAKPALIINAAVSCKGCSRDCLVWQRQSADIKEHKTSRSTKTKGKKGKKKKWKRYKKKRRKSLDPRFEHRSGLVTRLTLRSTLSLLRSLVNSADRPIC